MTPRTHYAHRAGTNIAYQVYGQGPIDMVFVTGLISHIEHFWEEPGLVRMFERQAGFARLVLVDRRGTGLSDPLHGPIALEDEVEDLTAVLDDVGSERAVLFGYTAGGPYVMQYAAKHPERVRALVLYACFARSVRAEDMPWVNTREERDERIAALLERWGEGSNLALLAPTMAEDPRLRDWLARMERLAASPGAMRALSDALSDVDVRPVLAELRVPTLVLHRRDDQLIDPRHSRYLAAHIPGAKLVELPGVDSLPFVGDTDALIGEVEEFLTGGRRKVRQRALLTVLFTDIVGATQRAAQLGDSRWRDLLAAHEHAARREVERFDGEVVKTVGDGVLAVYAGGPSEAVRSAAAVVRATGELGLDVRAGLHTGECELLGDDVGGMAVHIAARVSALAAPREVLASGTTYGTVVGSGLRFEDRGMVQLRGVPGRWPVFALQV